LTKKIILVSDKASAHNSRFIALLENIFPVDVFYLEEKSISFVQKALSKGEYEMLVFSPISLNLDELMRVSDIPTVGICLAFEVNELSKIPEYKKTISRNLVTADLIICDNAHIEKQLRLDYQFEKKIITARYGCDLNLFKNPPKITTDDLKIIVTRNWTNIHGNQLIIEGLKQLDNSGIPFRVRFIKWQEISECEINIPEFKVGKVELLDFLKPIELSAELSESWLYVSASSSDGSSVSMLEALANGNIVLVSDFAANLHIVKPGHNGFVFRNFSSCDLVKKIIEIRSQTQEELDRISKNANQTALSIGNWELESKTIMDGVHSILRRTGE